MVAFNDGEDVLFVVGGRGLIPFLRQPGAHYDQETRFTRTNEQHMFSLNTGE